MRFITFIVLLISMIFFIGCASISNTDNELVLIKGLSEEGSHFFISPYGRTEIGGSNVINGEGKDGSVRIYWCIVPRRKLKYVLKIIKEINPDAYITTDSVNPISLKK